jgi:hypothetical protein
MNTHTRLRQWRVSLPGNRETLVEGHKVVVSDAGCLLVLDSTQGGNPVRIFAREAWVDCSEVER